jgi:galactose mutarotase-like enzyme
VTDRHTINAAGLSATVLAQGAELCSVAGPYGEMLWQAGPAWPRHAPVLFPIVGRLPKDTLHHQGQDHRLTQHGFARDRRFDWVEMAPDRCVLRLSDDAATRATYPFAFRFTLSFQVADGALVVGYEALNTGDAVLPVNMGAHPAFRWPLADGVAKDAHRLEFEMDETAPVPLLTSGLLGPSDAPSPILDRVLTLSEAVFAHDAVILPAPASRAVRFVAPGAPGIEMRWDGFPSFGIWMRPPGDFLCLEPWHGMASPAGWDGDIVGKPGIALLVPGEALQAWYSVRVLDPATA